MGISPPVERPPSDPLAALFPVGPSDRGVRRPSDLFRKMARRLQ